MANKDLKYFMKKYEEEIITAPAPSSFVDENGQPIEMEIRVLPIEETTRIMNSFKKKRIASDKKGRPFSTVANEAIVKIDNDGVKAFNLLIVESLVYPNLKDEKLMEFHKCYDHTEMPYKVFPRAADYEYVSDLILKLYGMTREADESDSLVEEAKN